VSASSDGEGADSFARFRRPETQPLKVPKRLHHKPTMVPAVTPAHEGQSVNPENEAFEDFTSMAVAKQLEQERQNEEIERKIHPVSCELRDSVDPKELKSMSEEAKLQRYRSLTCQSQVESCTSCAGADGEARLDGRRVPDRRKQKSSAQRNRERKRRDVDAKAEQERTQKKLERSVGQVGTILKEFKNQSEWQKRRREYRVELLKKRQELEGRDASVRKLRIGRTRIREQPLVVPGVEAASKGLRATPLRTSMAQERLCSIVRRGMLPALPEFTKDDALRRKKGVSKLKRSRKFISPLLRDNLLLR